MRSGSSARGYAMVALLVALSVMSIMLTVALPTWRQMVQREKEAELVFRGEQYVRAIALYQRRQGPGTLPPTIDLLVEERYLRKAYKDPITGEDFVILRGGVGAGRGGVQPGRGATGGQGGRGAQAGRGSQGTQGGRGGQGGQPPQGGGSTFGAAAPIIGVVSSSEAASVRLYNGRGFYNEWEFVYTQQGGAGGAGAGPGGDAGRGAGGGRGGRQGADGARGRRGEPFELGGRARSQPDGRGRGQPDGRGRQGPFGGQGGFGRQGGRGF